jgi:hypothetical protein
MMHFDLAEVQLAVHSNTVKGSAKDLSYKCRTIMNTMLLSPKERTDLNVYNIKQQKGGHFKKSN